MDDELDQRHRQIARRRRSRVGVPAGAPEHGADREQRHRRRRIAEHADDLRQRAGQIAPGKCERRAEDDRPRQRVGGRAAQREQGRLEGRALALGDALFAVRVCLGERQADRAGDDQVDDDGADHRPGGGVAEQGDEQRHAHEAGVRECGDERAEGGVAQVDASGAARSAQRQRDRDGDDQERGDQVDAEQGGVGQARQRHAGQREEEHIGVEPGDCARRQGMPARGQPAEQDEREERDRDRENGLHPSSIARRAARRGPRA
jgi:hypothetical protein